MQWRSGAGGSFMQAERNVCLQKHTFGREARTRLQCSPVIISASPGVRSQSQQLCLQGLWALGECVSRTQHSNDVNTKPTAHHKTSNLHKTHTLPHVSTLSALPVICFCLNSAFKRYQIRLESVIIQVASSFSFFFLSGSRKIEFMQRFCVNCACLLLPVGS